MKKMKNEKRQDSFLQKKQMIEHPPTSVSMITFYMMNEKDQESLLDIKAAEFSH